MRKSYPVQVLSVSGQVVDVLTKAIEPASMVVGGKVAIRYQGKQAFADVVELKGKKILSLQLSITAEEALNALIDQCVVYESTGTVTNNDKTFPIPRTYYAKARGQAVSLALKGQPVPALYSCLSEEDQWSAALEGRKVVEAQAEEQTRTSAPAPAGKPLSDKEKFERAIAKQREAHAASLAAIAAKQAEPDADDEFTVDLTPESEPDAPAYTGEGDHTLTDEELEILLLGGQLPPRVPALPSVGGVEYEPPEPGDDIFKYELRMMNKGRFLSGPEQLMMEACETFKTWYKNPPV